ncbi:phosphate ABC transporter permease subunit PstC [Runella sp.]|uniref:phosphate ABC transporter permease subunit PstC n=1 Tax=Runella sp. TaxID=1960881 RepID=UPI003D12BC87
MNRTQFRILTDNWLRFLFLASGMLCIAVLLGIFVMLCYNTVAFFTQISLWDFISDSQWSPSSGTNSVYGLLPLLVSTLLVTVGALLLAVPLGVGTALFISEYAGESIKRVLKPTVEMLAAIPSVVIGFLGIVVISPVISMVFGLPNGLNALNGAILLAIMALPTIITVSEDAIHAVTHSLKEASLGLGASQWQTLRLVILPAAYPGIIAAVMLGMGRAIGETMTVLMATGNSLAFPKGFFDSIRTITATIAIEMGEVPYQTTHYYALFAIAFVLFLITMLVNVLAERIANNIRKFQ